MNSIVETLMIWIGRAVFGPAILLRPCGPARNCIGWRLALPALFGCIFYAFAMMHIVTAVIG